MWGPGGLALHVGNRVMYAYHLLPFARFATFSEDSTAVRAAFAGLASLLGGKKAIYIHEQAGPNIDLLTAGPEEVEHSLREQFGAPSPSFQALAAVELWQPGCWYIDTFA